MFDFNQTLRFAQINLAPTIKSFACGVPRSDIYELWGFARCFFKSDLFYLCNYPLNPNLSINVNLFGSHGCKSLFDEVVEGEFVFLGYNLIKLGLGFWVLGSENGATILIGKD